MIERSENPLLASTNESQEADGALDFGGCDCNATCIALSTILIAPKVNRMGP
jgi:hypothetical protein